MSAYEHAFRSALFPLYETLLRRRSTLRYLREYEASQWLPADRVAELQWHKLRRLIEHCWREVPYYQRRWKELGLTPEDIRSPADYALLPTLTKPEIRACFDELHASSWRGKLLYKTTGGSTGEPMRFGYTRESYERRIAAMWRGYAWAGARMGRRTLYLWGMAIGQPMRAHAIKDRLYHAAFNRHMLNAFLMREEHMPAYADEIDAFRAEVIVAYAGPLLRMAEWLLANGRSVHRPQAILSAAEALHDAQRAVIEQAFGCPVFNTYGCREFMLIASECGQRDGLHLTADHLAVELVGLQPSATGGSIGEIAVTDLHNYGMPLLRYLNGDLGTPSAKVCACGRGLPLLQRVDGRKLDTLRTPAGHLLPGEFIVYAFLGVTSIKRYQVVQREIGALDIRIVPDAGFDSSVLEQIRGEIVKATGTSMELRFELVDEIAASASGKFRVAICELH